MSTTSSRNIHRIRRSSFASFRSSSKRKSRWCRSLLPTISCVGLLHVLIVAPTRIHAQHGVVAPMSRNIQCKAFMLAADGNGDRYMDAGKEYIIWLNQMANTVSHNPHSFDGFIDLPKQLIDLYTSYAAQYSSTPQLDIHGIPGSLPTSPEQGASLDQFCADAVTILTELTAHTTASGAIVPNNAVVTPATNPATPVGAVSTTPAIPGLATTLPATPGLATTLPAIPGLATTLPAIPGLATTLPAIPGLATTLPAIPGLATTLPAIPGLATTSPAIPGLATTSPVLPGITTAPVIPGLATTNPVIPGGATATPSLGIPTLPVSIPGVATTAPVIPGLATTNPVVPGGATATPSLGASTLPVSVPGVATTAPVVPGLATTNPVLPGATTSPVDPGAASTAPGVPGQATGAPGVPRTDTTTCKSQMLVIDGDRNALMNGLEYIAFINKLSNNAFAQFTTVATLPAPLQLNFNNLEKGGEIEIVGYLPAHGASPDQLGFLDTICASTEQAIYEAQNGLPPGSAAALFPVLTPIPATTPAPTGGGTNVNSAANIFDHNGTATPSAGASSQSPVPKVPIYRANDDTTPLLTVHSSFLVAIAAGGTNAATLPDAWRDNIRQAYKHFVETTIPPMLASLGMPAASSTPSGGASSVNPSATGSTIAPSAGGSMPGSSIAPGSATTNPVAPGGATATPSIGVSTLPVSIPGVTTAPVVPGLATTNPVVPGAATVTPSLGVSTMPVSVTTAPAVPGLGTTSPVLPGAGTISPVIPGVASPVPAVLAQTALPTTVAPSARRRDTETQETITRYLRGTGRRAQATSLPSAAANTLLPTAFNPAVSAVPVGVSPATGNPIAATPNPSLTAGSPVPLTPSTFNPSVGGTPAGSGVVPVTATASGSPVPGATGSPIPGASGSPLPLASGSPVPGATGSPVPGATSNPSAGASTSVPSAGASSMGPSGAGATTGPTTLAPTTVVSANALYVGESAQLLDIKDSQECWELNPATPTGASCLNVYAIYNVQVSEGARAQVYEALVARTQNAIAGGTLQTSLDTAIPSSGMTILRSSTAVDPFPPAPPPPPATPAPTEAATEAPADGGSNSFAIGGGVAIGAVSLIVCCLGSFIMYKRGFCEFGGGGDSDNDESDKRGDDRYVDEDEDDSDR